MKHKISQLNGGNLFDKHNSKNLILKIVMKNFYNTILQQLQMLQIDSKTRIVDIGCGEGHLTNIISQNYPNRKIKGIDICNTTIKKAQVYYPGILFKQGDLLTIQEKQDILIATEVLEHIGDYKKAIINATKIAPICIFSVPNEPFFRIANICSFRYLNRLGNTPGHLHNWSKDELYTILKDNFNEVTITPTGVWNVALCKSIKKTTF